MQPQSLSPQFIFPRPDARPVDRATVKALAASIMEIGLLNPIRVRASGEDANGIAGQRYEVLAGNHRLQACLSLGLDEIACVVVDDDDLHAELATIDENLCRAELSPSDRARHTARRKEIYETLHPDTRHGAIGGGHDQSRQVGDSASTNNINRFTSATAAATGKSERVVQRDAERGEKVCAEALGLVRGTELDTGAYLDKLKKVATEDQVATVRRALDGIAKQAERDRRDAHDRAKRSKIERDVKDRAAVEVAEIIAAHVPADAWDGLKANLYAAGASNIANALANITGHSIMDARYAAE